MSDECLDPQTVRVRNLDFHLTSEDIADVMALFGEIEEIRLINRGGDSLGYCFVKFSEPDSVQSCLECESIVIGGRKVVVDQARVKTAIVDNILVHNIGQLVTVDQLREHFSRYHVVDAKIVCRYESEERKGFGFVRVASQADRDAAIRDLNHSDLGGRIIFVTAARSAFDASKRNFTRRKSRPRE